MGLIRTLARGSRCLLLREREREGKRKRRRGECLNRIIYRQDASCLDLDFAAARTLIYALLHYRLRMVGFYHEIEKKSRTKSNRGTHVKFSFDKLRHGRSMKCTFRARRFLIRPAPLIRLGQSSRVNLRPTVRKTSEARTVRPTDIENSRNEKNSKESDERAARGVAMVGGGRGGGRD